ncbi:hypothetical protein PPL_02511 [Heterostelium album PN500]|uniref:Serine protease n=1 Tax=Heterostelium pallidum (strain ATCC 26659 / Pp 5 / PN500) TaxID=670386 RepID=D3B2A2_HETP5|nr:hypothetical protein PPL_02511 [Heterostelium album PN500]EFA84477.1 hypothetical protein PPL_02511 [Heterostelium album PN500]|eukprot:XP_020436591.1 hypothetical protein PPL_02511 [Heterostelium album PN500]
MSNIIIPLSSDSAEGVVLDNSLVEQIVAIHKKPFHLSHIEYENTSKAVGRIFVRFKVPGKEKAFWSCGTGFCVKSNLVMTAAHVLSFPVDTSASKETQEMQRNLKYEKIFIYFDDDATVGDDPDFPMYELESCGRECDHTFNDPLIITGDNIRPNRSQYTDTESSGSDHTPNDSLSGDNGKSSDLESESSGSDFDKTTNYYLTKDKAVYPVDDQRYVWNTNNDMEILRFKGIQPTDIDILFPMIPTNGQEIDDYTFHQSSNQQPKFDHYVVGYPDEFVKEIGNQLEDIIETCQKKTIFIGKVVSLKDNVISHICPTLKGAAGGILANYKSERKFIGVHLGGNSEITNGNFALSVTHPLFWHFYHTFVLDDQFINENLQHLEQYLNYFKYKNESISFIDERFFLGSDLDKIFTLNSESKINLPDTELPDRLNYETASKAVGRIFVRFLLPGNIEEWNFGTGFCVKNDTVVTSGHLLQYQDQSKIFEHDKIYIYFGYDATIESEIFLDDIDNNEGVFELELVFGNSNVNILKFKSEPPLDQEYLLPMIPTNDLSSNHFVIGYPNHIDFDRFVDEFRHLDAGQIMISIIMNTRGFQHKTIFNQTSNIKDIKEIKLLHHCQALPGTSGGVLSNSKHQRTFSGIHIGGWSNSENVALSVTNPLFWNAYHDYVLNDSVFIKDNNSMLEPYMSFFQPFKLSTLITKDIPIGDIRTFGKGRESKIPLSNSTLDNKEYYENIFESNNFGSKLSSGESITLNDGQSMTVQQLYLKSIECDPTNSMSYYNLATTLSRGESITLNNGQSMTKQQLLLKSIDYDPTNSYPYHNLAPTLSRGESITLNNGQSMTQQIFLKSIELYPTNSNSYHNLATTLSRGESITLNNGQSMTKQQLFLKSIECDPTNSYSYYSLATTLSRFESITLNDGQSMTVQQLYLKSIECDPTNSNSYHNLAKTLSNGESITLNNGQSMTKQQIFLKSLECDPTNSISYNSLATTLSRGESITLNNGQSMTQQLYLKSIECDSMSYYNLAMTLSRSESFTLNNGQSMTQQQLYLKSIECDPTNSNSYNNLTTTLSRGESITLNNGQSMTQQQLYLKSIELDPTNSNSYYNLTMTLSNGESITLNNGQSMTVQQLLLKSIECDPTNSYSYYSLATTLSRGESITLNNGRSMTQQQLYLKSIELDPTNSYSYYSLANTLSRGESITLNNGQSMTVQQIFLKSIELDPTNSNSYYNLATTLSRGESITLNNGQSMTQQQLFLKSIECDPTNSYSYHSFATTLSRFESITLNNGQSMTVQQLYLKSIELDPTNSNSYYSLAMTLSRGESITLNNGQSMTVQQLFLKSIECDPTNSNSYNNLAMTLSRFELITLPNGQSMTKQQIFLKSIECDPTNSNSYHNLATTLSRGESITLNNGQSMTEQQLFLKSIELDPTNSYSYYNLAPTLSRGESITLNNGQSMTQQQLYLKSIELDPTNSYSYYSLANTLSRGESITLNNGQSMTEQQLYLKSIDCNPNQLHVI